MMAALGCAALLVAACASVPPPKEEMAVARAAIANALGAGGVEYAPVEMRTAQEKMDRASRAMDKEEYDTARRLATEAQADARLAEKMAQAGKARKAESVTREDVRVLREEMNRSGK
jgi:hypothetical protein